jgi:hypothetical protein
LWQRSPVAQSPSPAQYFRQAAAPAVAAVAMHPAPRPHGIAAEQGLPIAPPSVLGQQATTAVVPAQPKSHFCAPPQLCATGSQPIAPVSVSASPEGPSPAAPSPGAASGVPSLVPPHAAAATATMAASASFRTPSRFTLPLYRRMKRNTDLLIDDVRARASEKLKARPGVDIHA